MVEDSLFAKHDYPVPVLYFNIFCRVFLQLSYIHATAEVQKPEICVLSSDVFLEEVYVDVPVVKEIVLENKTLLSSNISWNKVSSLPRMMASRYSCDAVRISCIAAFLQF